jgi:hypothetical protein
MTPESSRNFGHGLPKFANLRKSAQNEIGCPVGNER